MGQLAADLIVSSMGAERVGYLDDPYVLPCVGNDAYGPFPQGVLALPLEGAALSFCLFCHCYNFFVSCSLLLKCSALSYHFFLMGFAAYESPSNALTILQQRSPVVKVSA